MHERLENLLTNPIADELATTKPSTSQLQIPIKLFARYVASTFVLALDW